MLESVLELGNMMYNNTLRAYVHSATVTFAAYSFHIAKFLRNDCNLARSRVAI